MTTPILNNQPPATGIASLISASKNSSSQNGINEGINIFGEDGFTFGDILDIVNPLHHIPIIGMIYRKLTGDTIAPAMQIAGDGLFGGPIGAAISVVTTIIQSQFKTDSNDPSSPYMDQDSTTTDPATIANNKSHHFPRTIGSNDYSQTTDSTTRQSNHTSQDFEKPAEAQYEWSIRAAISKNAKITNTNKEITIDNKNELSANMNTLQSNNFYQPKAGIVNLVYKGTETYTNVVTSNNTLTNSIDVIIGSRVGPGSPGFSI